MNPGIIAFIVIYVVLLFAYFITETTGKMKLRAPNKIALALSFFIFGVTMILTLPQYSSISYHYILIVALFLAMLGDIFLLFSYNRGGDFFLCGNICFVTYETLLLLSNNIAFSSFWWVLLIAGVLFATWIILFNKFPDYFKLGKMKKPMILYLSSIILHGSLGIAVMVFLPKHVLLGAGSFLFMLSDFDIVFHKFVYPESKWCLRLNSALYFTGLLLIVLSIPFSV